jgi:hypothetical protein
MYMQRKTYTISGIVFILSISITLLLPIGELFKSIAAMPAIGVLIGVLYQTARDHIAHEKQIELQKKRQFFDLGATSHMANTVFDKHVEFCEKYMIEVHKTLLALIQKGLTKDAITNANKLYGLRQEYSAWVTEEIAIELNKFESAVRSVGTRTGLAESFSNSPSEAEKGLKARHEAEDLFVKILGEYYGNDQTIDDELAVEKVKAKIRGILGIEELTKIRKWIVSQAIGMINNGT